MNERGFELVDLMLALALLGLFSITGLVSFRGIAREQALQQASQSFVQTLGAARLRSLSEGTSYQVLVSPDSRGFAVVWKGADPARWTRLDRPVFFSRIPRRPVVFYSRGGASPAGSYVLSNGRHKVRVVVSLNGRVRWERK